MKLRISIVLSLVVVALGCGTKETPVATTSAPRVFNDPPIILISIDTLRSDHLPAYGYAGVSTPAIDAMKREAILFERAYAPTPMTFPSHLSMLTGQLPATHGVRNNVGFTFDAEKHFYLPCHLKAKGYETGAAVSTYVLRREGGLASCFDLYDDAIDPRASSDTFTAQQRSGWATLEKATEWLNTRADEPLFFFFHIYEPHVPYDPPEPYKSLYPNPYDGEIATADAIVGKFVESLRAMGIWDRAIVILTSDHGEGLGDHGEEQHSVLLNRELIQVPMLIKLPSGYRGGETVSSPVQLSDIVPTVLALSGDRVEPKFDGASIVGETPDAERPIFSETLYPRIHLGWSDLASLVQGRFHYIEAPRSELYDVVADPAEKNNLLDSERRTAASMKKTIEGFRVPMKPLEAVDSETVKKMAALGYVGAPAARTGPLPDPKDHIKDLETIRTALLLSQSGRVAESVSMLRELLSSNPGMVEGWSKLGDVLTDAGDYPAAADAYREAIRVSTIVSPDLMIDAGHAFMRAERLDEAAAMADAVADTIPIRAWDLRARVDIARGRYAEAEKAARQAQHDPVEPADLVLLAAAIQKQGRFEETLKLLAEAKQVAEESGVWPVYGLLTLKGDTLARQGDFAGAVAAYQADIDNFPSNLKAWSALSVLYFINGDRAKVDRTLETMVAKNPGPGAMLVAAKTLDALDDPQGAARWRERARGR